MKIEAVLGVVVALAVAGLAKADIIIDFQTAGAVDNGTLSYAGGAAPLVGTDFGIGGVRGVDTLSNAGTVFGISDGLLNFTTGNLLSYAAGVYTWAGGGSFTITGTGPGCKTVGGCGGGVSDEASGPILLSGNFLSATYYAGYVRLAIAVGSDVKDKSLVRFFGYNPANTTFQFSGSIHTQAPQSGKGGSFTAKSGASTDIANSVHVPDGGTTALLLGMVLAVGGLLSRRKR